MQLETVVEQLSQVLQTGADADAFNAILEDYLKSVRSDADDAVDEESFESAISEDESELTAAMAYMNSSTDAANGGVNEASDKKGEEGNGDVHLV